VDDAVEAARELLAVVGEVGRQVHGRAVVTQDDAVLFVAELTRDEEGAALLLLGEVRCLRALAALFVLAAAGSLGDVGLAELLVLLDEGDGLSALVQHGLARPDIEADVELLERGLDGLQVLADADLDAARHPLVWILAEPAIAVFVAQ